MVLNNDLSACESSVLTRTQRLEAQDLHSNSHGILPPSHSSSKRLLPGVFPTTGHNPIITIIDKKSQTQQLRAPPEEATSELPQVIQVHSKHYHYNLQIKGKYSSSFHLVLKILGVRITSRFRWRRGGVEAGTMSTVRTTH